MKKFSVRHFCLGLLTAVSFWMSDRPQIIYGNHLPNHFKLSVRGNHDVLLSNPQSPVPCPAVARELPARPRLAAPAHADCSLGRDGRALTGGVQECQPRLPPSSLPQVIPPAGAMGFQESRSVHCSQLIRASRTPCLLSEAIGKSSCNPAFELRGYCRLQWVY